MSEKMLRATCDQGIPNSGQRVGLFLRVEQEVGREHRDRWEETGERSVDRMLLKSADHEYNSLLQMAVHETCHRKMAAHLY